jgi:hypothetical protein
VRGRFPRRNQEWRGGRNSAGLLSEHERTADDHPALGVMVGQLE